MRCVSHTGEVLVGWREAVQELAQNTSVILESEPRVKDIWVGSGLTFQLFHRHSGLSQCQKKTSLLQGHPSLNREGKDWLLCCQDVPMRHMKTSNVSVPKALTCCFHCLTASVMPILYLCSSFCLSFASVLDCVCLCSPKSGIRLIEHLPKVQTGNYRSLPSSRVFKPWIRFWSCAGFSWHIFTKWPHLALYPVRNLPSKHLWCGFGFDLGNGSSWEPRNCTWSKRTEVFYSDSCRPSLAAPSKPKVCKSQETLSTSKSVSPHSVVGEMRRKKPRIAI